MSSKRSQDQPSELSEEAKRGIAYEPHAIARYAEANKDRKVVPGNQVPPLLLAAIHGEPLTVEGLQKCVKLCAEWENELLETGKRSELTGIDGVAVAKVPFLTHKIDELKLEILEAKSRKKGVNCHILGTSIGVMLRAVGVYGADNPRMPVLKVLSPQRPTSNVYWVFAQMPHLYEHVPIPLPTETAPTQVVKFELRKLQDTCMRCIITALRPTRDNPVRKPVVVTMACGLGKSVMALVTLKDASWAYVGVFVVHEARMAGQIEEEAKMVGVKTINLTCTRSKKHEGKEEEEGEEEGEEGEGDEEGEEEGEESEEEAPPTKGAQSERIIKDFERHAKTATKEARVCLIVCHHTLKIMTSMRSAEGEKKKKSQWSGILERIGDWRRVLMVVDEWHKLKRAEDLFTSLFETPKQCQVVLMSATEPSENKLVNTLGEKNAAIIKEATRLGGVGVRRGIEDGFLVKAHVETVYATDAKTGEAVACSKTPLAERATTVAAWMVVNKIRTAVCYCSGIEEADEFQQLLQTALEEASDGCPAWCRAMHSGKACGGRTGRKNIENEFKKPKTRKADPDYRVLVAVNMLREGFNFPGLEACVLLAIPVECNDVMQVIQRVMRAHGTKTVGRVLLVGADSDGGRVAALLRDHDGDRSDPDKCAFSLGATPSTLQGYADVHANNGEARAVHARKAKAYQERVTSELEWLVARHDVRVWAHILGYLEAFPTHAPTPKDSGSFTYKLCGKTRTMSNAYGWRSQVRADWHRNIGSYVTSEKQKEALLAAGVERFGAAPAVPAPAEERAAQAEANAVEVARLAKLVDAGEVDPETGELARISKSHALGGKWWASLLSQRRPNAVATFKRLTGWGDAKCVEFLDERKRARTSLEPLVALAKRVMAGETDENGQLVTMPSRAMSDHHRRDQAIVFRTMLHDAQPRRRDEFCEAMGWTAAEWDKNVHLLKPKNTDFLQKVINLATKQAGMKRKLVKRDGAEGKFLDRLRYAARKPKPKLVIDRAVALVEKAMPDGCPGEAHRAPLVELFRSVTAEEGAVQSVGGQRKRKRKEEAPASSSNGGMADSDDQDSE
jgi:hypothetical protein